MALCAPRFPENVSGIASCSEMGSTHSRTLHSGQVPLALSCGELAVELASCLEPTNALALCAPRFPENVSGIASCSEMGSTHSCTLHSGLAPLALSCGALAVEPASCLEPTTSLALCTPRFPDVLSGIASCTDMGSRPSCTLHSSLPTFAPRCDEHAGGPGSYRRASNVLEANDTDPPSNRALLRQCCEDCVS